MNTSLKAGFTQIFSCCPKNLSCPKFGGGGGLQSPSPPRPYAYGVKLNISFNHVYTLVRMEPHAQCVGKINFRNLNFRLKKNKCEAVRTTLILTKTVFWLGTCML